MVNGRIGEFVFPRRDERKEKESSAALFGNGFSESIISFSVANRSVVQIVCLEIEPALTLAGHLTRNGVRCHPSKISALCPLKLELGLCPCLIRSGIFA